MKIHMYGKPECPRCDIMKAVLPDSEYHEHGELFDHYPMEEASQIVVESGGLLTILIVERSDGARVVMSATKSSIEPEVCGDGSCEIQFGPIVERFRKGMV